MKELIQRLHSDFDRTDTAQWKQIIQKWIHDSVKHRIVDFGFQDLSLCEKF
ncbi:MAG: hypothetical protein U9Q15_01215 [Patescibacteria group bacterium]|nr:hypothetical protein [Patescibacteria group bacterium]